MTSSINTLNIELAKLEAIIMFSEDAVELGEAEKEYMALDSILAKLLNA